MADNADIVLQIWDALPRPAEPEGWLSAPIIDCWFAEAYPNEKEIGIAGRLPSSAKLGREPMTRTAALTAVDERRRFVIASNGVYRLGWPARISLEADSEHLWPPALLVATCYDWYSALDAALAYTGDHTLPDELMDALTAAVHDDGGWEERRGAATAIGLLALTTGRHSVCEAWRVLAADLRRRDSRVNAAAVVRQATEQAGRMYERDLTVEEKLAAEGWRLIATMDDHQISKLPSEGVNTDDPIRAAHRVATIVENISKLPKPKFVDSDIKDNGNGLVVMSDIGGADQHAAVRAFFEPIAGRKLPLTPVPDLTAVQKTLSGEFPHACQQIAVILSDLVGRSSVRLRPTILVGKPGSGKSRLARRLGETLGLHIVRYDGAAASDSSFGGTARRWSTGEPSVAVAALLSARKADALVLIDEIEKAGTGRHNGNFIDSLLGFLESETAKRYPDPYAQTEIDVSRVSYIATANDASRLPVHLRDRFRMIRIAEPGPEYLQALARFIVNDLAAESGMDERWFPPLNDGELYIAAGLWRGGSIRRLREIVARIVVKRAEMPRH